MTRFKIGLGILGMAVGLTGIALQNRLVVWIAVGLLGASLLLRIVMLAREKRAEREPPEE